MRFIPNEKYSIVKKMAMEGNEQAKNFLGNFMEMDDTEANDYLSSVSINPDEILKGIEFLIKDENEAIDGYDKQIKIIQNSNMDESKKVVFINTLQHIKEEELEHIQELLELKENKDGVDKEQESILNT